MGKEMLCRTTFGKESGEGKALLETNEILFRGPFRLKIPLKSISAIDARGGKLLVTFPDGKAAFELGQEVAEKWRDKVLNPPSLMDKLGVKPESRVCLVDMEDAAFVAELKQRKPQIAEKDCDIVFFHAAKDADLKRLSTLQKRLSPKGALWVIYPKGQKQITEMSVLTAGRGAGLVDIKVASVSEVLTGLKFVKTGTRKNTE